MKNNNLTKENLKMKRTVITIIISGIIFFSIGFLFGKEYKKEGIEKIENQKLDNPTKGILEIYDSL